MVDFQTTGALLSVHAAVTAAAGGGSNVYDQVETSRVLLFMAAVLVFVICLELFLHFLEHATKRKPKYADMLHKTTQELMIVGLIYLLVKFCVSTGLAKANGLAYQALDFADLLILFTVLAMVLQATVILFRLRKTNLELGKISILRTENVLANAMAELNAATQKSRLQRYFTWSKLEYQLQMKLLRCLFLRSYDLPQLFPFDKYVEDVQDSQVAHLVEIDISMWIVLMATYALFFLLSGELLSNGEFKAHTTVRWWVFIGFAASLFVLMVGLLVYLRKLVQLLLQHAAKKVNLVHDGSSSWTAHPRSMATPEAMTEALSHVVHYEANLAPMLPHEAIETMRRISDELSDASRDSHHGGFLAHLFAHDLLCGLLGTLGRRFARTRPADKHKGKMHGVDSLRLPYFSRKVVHFVIQLLFVLNGFYYALFINCVLYLDGFNVAAALKAALVVVPLVLNTFVVAPMITREFSVINSLFRVDAKKLSTIVEHFAEVETMKDDMVCQVLQHLHHSHQTLADLAAALANADASDDDAGDGFVDVDVLRGILKQFGFRFQRQKFTTLVRLHFDTKGTTIRYHDLLALLGDAQASLRHRPPPNDTEMSFQSFHLPPPPPPSHDMQPRQPTSETTYFV